MARPKKKTARRGLELTTDEIGLLTNALNYVCNGIALDEFETLFGGTRREAERLLDKLARAKSA